MYYGQAGHFIGAKRCRFHIHTHVRGYCVSTVGEWFPKSGGADVDGDARGCEVSGIPDSFYETMVFELDVDGDHDARPLTSMTYPTRDLANVGHEFAVRFAESGQCRGDMLYRAATMLDGRYERPVELCDALQGSPSEAVFYCALGSNHAGACAPGRAPGRKA